MKGNSLKKIPKEAIQAVEMIEELLDRILVGVYLYGSAVMGGLRINSDVDILVVTNQSLSEKTRRELTNRLMLISGKIGNANAIRPLEVTVINQKDVVPWQFPPKYEFMYGEWLRDQFEKGDMPSPTYDPDLAILLALARENSMALLGVNAAEVLDPVPIKDIQRAIKESLPGLIEDIKGDERNVILTLARMWFTASTSEISSKDQSAEWAIPQLPEYHAALLHLARKAYLGERVDKWEGREIEVTSLVHYMKKSIESCLNI
ncbi:adenylyltransferase [Bacillus sp. VT-16-64]|nr:adenylyltransferase [Bacillus sp. VT-16-64]